MTFGCERPQGVLVRTFNLDPRGNSEEAEAARKALSVYADALALSSHKRLRNEADAIGRWIQEEILAAEMVKCAGACG